MWEFGSRNILQLRIQQSNSSEALVVLQMWTRKCFFFSLSCMSLSTVYTVYVIKPWVTTFLMYLYQGLMWGEGGRGVGCAAQGSIWPWSDGVPGSCLTFLYDRVICTHGNSHDSSIKLIQGHNLSRNTARWYYLYTRTIFDFFFLCINTLRSQTNIRLSTIIKKGNILIKSFTNCMQINFIHIFLVTCTIPHTNGNLSSYLTSPDTLNFLIQEENVS